MPLWLVVPFVAFEMLGFLFAFRAQRNMAPDVTDPFIEMNARSALFRGRGLFTERGWRYRNVALTLHACGIATFLLWLVWSLIGK